MKPIKKLSILLAIVGVTVVLAVAILSVIAYRKQPSVGIIGGADLPTLLFLLKTRTPAIGWLMASGGLCLIASAVTAVIGAIANKRSKEE